MPTVLCAQAPDQQAARPPLGTLTPAPTRRCTTKATASVSNSKITKRGRSTRPPVSLGRVSTRQSYFEPVSGFEPLTVRLQGQSRCALCGPAKTVVTDEPNRATRKVHDRR